MPSLQPRAAVAAVDHTILKSTTLSPLPVTLRHGIPAVAVFAFLSFFSSIALLTRLVYRLITSPRHNQLYKNQFLILILNLLIADIQQSIAFWVNVDWLRTDAIDITSPTCFAQGFFVSVGDLASGVFTIAIAVHTFLDIVLAYRPSPRTFYISIFLCHAFVYIAALIGIAMHPSDLYVRAVAWCWINSKYQSERLWLHYFWILIAEFGTVIIYTALFLILRARVNSGFYAGTPGGAARAKAAAKAIIPYPIIYVVCTCPLAAARISSMTGNIPSYGQMMAAGALITCNGWLDVLLYGLTRRQLLFGDVPLKPDMSALDTFYWGGDEYGTTTVIEGPSKTSRRLRRHSSKRTTGGPGASTEELVEVEMGTGLGMKVRTEVQVSSAPAEHLRTPGRGSGGRDEDTRSGKSLFKDEFYGS